MSAETSDRIKTIVVGLSGPSSSGKTTLARLLRSIFNVSTHGCTITFFIVHEDDFYKTDVDIPYREWTSPSTQGLRKEQDWDCVESLDLPLLSRVLNHVKSTGYLPADFASKEDQNSVGETGVSTQTIDDLKGGVERWIVEQSSGGGGDAATQSRNLNLRICILEGFLLFPPSLSYIEKHLETFESQTSPSELGQLSSILESALDGKVFLPCSRDLTVERRARRSGYVTLEGFWADPPGYVEELVWPNYKRDHGWLFDSEENVDRGVTSSAEAKERGVILGPGTGDAKMKDVLEWAVDIMKAMIVNAIRDE